MIVAYGEGFRVTTSDRNTPPPLSPPTPHTHTHTPRSCQGLRQWRDPVVTRAARYNTNRVAVLQPAPCTVHAAFGVAGVVTSTSLTTNLTPASCAYA